jgi:hypothetical protein
MNGGRWAVEVVWGSCSEPERKNLFECVSVVKKSFREWPKDDADDTVSWHGIWQVLSAWGEFELLF